MSLYSGKDAKVSITGAAIALPNPTATTNIDGLTGGYREYKVTTSTYKFLDEATAITVQKRIGGGGWGAITQGTDYKVRWAGGVIVLLADGTVDTEVQITAGKYLPYTTLADATGWKLEANKESVEITTLNMPAKKRKAILLGGTATIEGFWADDFFLDSLGGLLGLELLVGGTTRWEIIGRPNKDSIDFSYDNVAKESLDIDIDGEFSIYYT